MNGFVFKGEVREEEAVRAPGLQGHHMVEKQGNSQKSQFCRGRTSPCPHMPCHATGSPQEATESWGRDLPNWRVVFFFWCVWLLSMETADGTFSLAFWRTSLLEVKHEKFQRQSCKHLKLENDNEILMQHNCSELFWTCTFDNDNLSVLGNSHRNQESEINGVI